MSNTPIQPKHISAIRVCLAILAAAAWSLRAQSFDAAAGFVPDEVIVQFDTSASADNLAEALRRGGLTVKKHLPAGGKHRDDSGLVVLKTWLTVAQALAALRDHPAVRYAEPNVIKRTQATSNDPNYVSGKLWGMYGDATAPANVYGSQAGEAWAAGNVGGVAPKRRTEIRARR